MLPSADKTNGVQKFLALGLLGALGYGAVLLLNKVIPPINMLIHNMWQLLLWGGPLALIIIYVVSNPLVIWGFFKTISWKLTSWLIRMDPLSVMDRYVDYLTKKLSDLQGTITILVGKKTKLDRQIGSLKERIENNLQLGQASIKQGKKDVASVYGTKIQTDKSTMTLLMPLQIRIDKNLEFLKALSDNWQYGIEKLKYQIEGKRSEYEIIKETTRGLKSAEDFINSDNQAARLYGQGLKELEESVTQKIGYIDEFTRKSKPMMDSITVEKQAVQDEGLAELESYMQSGKLNMPDFSNIGGITDLAYETVPVNSPSSKFGLLGK